MLIAVGDAVQVKGLSLDESALSTVGGVEIRECPACLFVKAFMNRDVQCLAQQPGPWSAEAGGGAALRIQGVAEHLGHAKRLGDRLCPQREFDRGRALRIYQPLVSQAGVGPGQFRAWPERLEDRHGLLRCRRGFTAAAQAAHRAGEPRMVSPSRSRSPARRHNSSALCLASRRPEVGRAASPRRQARRIVRRRWPDPRARRTAAPARTGPPLRGATPVPSRGERRTARNAGRPGHRRFLRRERPSGHRRRSPASAGQKGSRRGRRRGGGRRSPARPPAGRSRA